MNITPFYIVGSFLALIALLYLVQRTFDFLIALNEPSDSWLEAGRARKFLRRSYFWWSWKKSRMRRLHWRKKHLYPSHCHLEYQALLLVEIGAHALWIESLDPDHEERSRLGREHQALLDEYVEKNCAPLDPALIT